MPWLTENYANSSSPHLFGFEASLAVDRAREQVASLLNARPGEIVFTSGATESINLAIKGIASSRPARKGHIITLQTEHSAVLDTCRSLEETGIETTYLQVDQAGLVDLHQLEKAIRPETILISIMQANNETGVLQPMDKISVIARNAGIPLFSDTTQAVGKVPVNMKTSGIDLLCFSAHKFYGPKGIGGLCIRNNPGHKLKVNALIHGGGHEQGRRSGTLNIPGIVGLGMAAELAGEEMQAEGSRIELLRDELEQALMDMGAIVNGSRGNRLPGTSNLRFRYLDAGTIIQQLGARTDGGPRIMLSNGSACNSGSSRPSPVLTAMGLSAEEVLSSLRFSLGRYTGRGDISQVIEVFKSILQPA